MRNIHKLSVIVLVYFVGCSPMRDHPLFEEAHRVVYGMTNVGYLKKAACEVLKNLKKMLLEKDKEKDILVLEQMILRRKFLCSVFTSIQIEVNRNTDAITRAKKYENNYYEFLWISKNLDDEYSEKLIGPFQTMGNCQRFEHRFREEGFASRPCRLMMGTEKEAVEIAVFGKILPKD